MKKLINRIFFLSIAIFFTINVIAQSTAPIYTADSLRSGNGKDVFTSFFQLGFDNLISNKKEFNFTSNPFAIMLKSNPSLAVDTNILSHNFLRKLNFGFGIKLDSSYHFNGFSSGIKIAIINKRDSVVSKWLRDQSFNDNQNEILHLKFIDTIVELKKNNKIDEKEERYLSNNANKLFDRNTKFSDLDSSFRTIVKGIIKAYQLKYFDSLIKKDSTINFGKAEYDHYTSFKNDLQNKFLWTASINDTTYNDQFFFSNIVLETELLQGISNYKTGKGKTNIELDIKPSVNFVDDSLKSGRNLDRAIFNFEPGFNLILNNHLTKQSWLEFKLSGEYNHIFSGIYSNEKKDSLTLNATLRIRIFDDLWLPLEIKYDPKSGNVFGFLNVHFNFTGLGNLLKSQTSRS